MAAAQPETDYVLGTHDDEVERLGLQHRVWRPVVTECWQRAGLTEGWRVLDVGAGPGYATADLAEIVGPSGAVLAIERSARFLEAARARCRQRGLENVQFLEADLMERSLGEFGFDAAWCRWVASFVSSPEKLVANMARALRPGGLAIFHEYSDYETFRFMPIRPALESFTSKVMESWRASGGEPDVARVLPELLSTAGFRVLEITPRVRTVSPQDEMWQWPKSFVEINVQRLRELGRVSTEWAADVLREFAEAEAASNSWFTTPMFLEIIARRE
ncbi:MAG TPA: methyltransferase domain-containing protein [Chthoniobacterales bacterium]|nr:methyltransferase domain-containing protein [Chthoniobacterales bacterium]